MSTEAWIDFEDPLYTTFPIPGLYSSLRYRFNNAQDWTGCEIAIKRLSMYYSWPNFATAYGNLTGLSYTFPTGSGSVTTFAVPIPQGFYTFVNEPGAPQQDTPQSIAQGIPPVTINGLLWQSMYNKGLYLNDINGDPFFFLALEINEANYTLTAHSTAIPVAVGMGTQVSPYTAPPPYVGFYNTTGLYVGTQTNGGTSYGLFPQLILSNAVLQTQFGMTSSTGGNVILPTSSNNNSIAAGLQFTNANGNAAPKLIQATSVTVTCSVASQPSQNKTNQIFQFPVNGPFLSLLDIEPINLSWVPCNSGEFNLLDIQFFDPSGQLLIAQDPQGFIQFTIRDVGLARHDLGDSFVPGSTTERQAAKRARLQ